MRSRKTVGDSPVSLRNMRLKWVSELNPTS